MSTPDTCQIAEYVKAANNGTYEACSNAASQTVGLTMFDVTFYFKVCPGCYKLLLEEMKQAVLQYVKERNRSNHNNAQ
jgi:hypothetical protein